MDDFTYYPPEDTFDLINPDEVLELAAQSDYDDDDTFGRID